MGISVDSWNSPQLELERLESELSEKNIYITQLENKITDLLILVGKQQYQISQLEKDSDYA